MRVGPDLAQLECGTAADVLRPEHVQQYLAQPMDLRWKQSTGTTNDDAKELGRSGVPEAVCIAEEQGMGKGRNGRSWISGKENAVELSLLLRPDLSASHAPELALAAAMAVRDAVQQLTGTSASVKWPNDVLLNGRKICGILCEAAVERGRLSYVVIGIGVNLNQPEFPEPIRKTATSLAIETGVPVDRAKFSAALINSVRARVDQVARGGIGSMMREYEEASSVLHRTVDVTTVHGVVTGECTGFGPHGELEVRVGDNTCSFLANDVSVREAPNV